MRAYELKDQITINEDDSTDIEEIRLPTKAYRIYLPKSPNELDQLSDGTSWSTQDFNSPSFSNGPIYVIENTKTGDKWRWHFETVPDSSRPYLDQNRASVSIPEFAASHKVATLAIIRHFGGLEKIITVDPKNWIELAKEVTPEMQMNIVKHNPMNIQYLEDPSMALQKFAVDATYGDAIEVISNSSLNIQLYALKHFNISVSQIKNPKDEVLKRAIEKDPKEIGKLINPPAWLQIMAIEEQPSLLLVINQWNIRPTQAPEAQIKAFELDKRAHEWMKPPSSEALTHMASTGLDISRYLKGDAGVEYLITMSDPQLDLKIMAAQANGMSLDYILKKTETAREDLPKIILAAVNQNGMALRFVDAQTQIEMPQSISKRIQMTALKQNPKSSRFVKHPSPEVKELMKQLGR